MHLQIWSSIYLYLYPGVIKCTLSYNTPGKASYLATFFYQLGGLFVSWRGSLIVGGVVLRSDAPARALIYLSPGVIKCRLLYITHWQASDLPRLFLSARGGSLSVGGVVLRSDALASALIKQ